jgi:hypothetical protein
MLPPGANVVAKFPVNCELPHMGAEKYLSIISPSSREAERKCNAHRIRYRRRGRDWPDLVGRRDVPVGSPGERGNEVGRGYPAL